MLKYIFLYMLASPPSWISLSSILFWQLYTKSYILVYIPSVYNKNYR